MPDTADRGVHCQGYRWLHITVLLTGGTSCVWRLWLWDPVAELWRLDTRPGASGSVTLLTAGSDNPSVNIFEIDGEERAYIELATVTGATVDVWLSGSGTVAGG